VSAELHFYELEEIANELRKFARLLDHIRIDGEEKEVVLWVDAVEDRDAEKLLQIVKIILEDPELKKKLPKFRIERMDLVIEIKIPTIQ